jgi:hypothetical protein
VLRYGSGVVSSPLPVFEAERVRSRIRTGSSSPVVVETGGGLFVAKLRGAGHGVPALVAEIIVAELAEQLGLPVPERVLLELPAELPSDDRNDELAQLLEASVGLNLGFRQLPGAQDPRPEDLARVSDEFAARVLWLDGLVMNLDRSVQNPNILFWKRQPWLIDHGAALPFQHRWSDLTEQSPREPMDYSQHVFRARLHLLPALDASFAESSTRQRVQAAVEQVPDAFMAAVATDHTLERGRALFQAFLWKRLKAPRPFV